MSDNVTIQKQPKGWLPDGVVLPMKWKDTVLVELEKAEIGDTYRVTLEDPGKIESLHSTVYAFGKKFKPRRRFTVVDLGGGNAMIVRRPDDDK